MRRMPGNASSNSFGGGIFFFNVVGAVERIDEGGAGDLDHDRLAVSGCRSPRQRRSRRSRPVRAGRTWSDGTIRNICRMFRRSGLPSATSLRKASTSNGSSTGTVLLAMPAKRLPVIALRRAKASAGGSAARPVRLAAAASQLTSLSVMTGLSISPAVTGPPTSNARVTTTARFNKRPSSGPPPDCKVGWPNLTASLPGIQGSAPWCRLAPARKRRRNARHDGQRSRQAGRAPSASRKSSRAAARHGCI